MSSYTVIGCGYVGSYAAANLKYQGHYLTGTTRSSERFSELRHVVNEPLSLDISDATSDFTFLELSLIHI